MDIVIIGVIIAFVDFFLFLFLKIPSKISVAISLIMISISAVVLVYGDVNLANDIATIAYFMLIASVALVIAENIRTIRGEQSTEDEEVK